MKICYVLSHFYPFIGGAEKFFLDIISRLVEEGKIEARVITCNSGISGHHKYKGIDIYSYDWPNMFGHSIIRKKDVSEHVQWADIVHTAIYTPVGSCINLCKKYNKPIITTVYESLNNKWFWIEKNKIKALMFYMYEKYVLNLKSDYFHTISMASHNDLMVNNKKANDNMIYCSCEPSNKKIKSDHKKLCDYFNVSNKSRVVLNYGRPGKTKGIFIYLEAIRLFMSNKKNRNTDLEFCFVMGNNPLAEKQKFLKKVKKYELEKKIHVVDPVDRDVLDIFIKSADCVIVPSITEGFGLSAIEACELCSKLIYSSAGSLPEVTYGKVMEFRNRDSKDLCKCINDYNKNDDKNFIIKERKDFSKDKICPMFYELYSKILNGDSDE